MTSKIYFVGNNTAKALILADLNIKIEAWTSRVNVFRLNPKLTHENIRVSEREGSLKKCFELKKLVRLPDKAPAEITFTNNIKEATKPIPSRVKSSVILDPTQNDYISELTGEVSEKNVVELTDMTEGFVDPLKDIVEETVVAEEYAEAQPPPVELKAKFAPVGLLKNKIVHNISH